MLKQITDFLTAPFRRFGREEKASLSIEALILTPVFFGLLLTMFTLFDVFRARSMSLKANYAVSDLLSRETNPVNASYMEGLYAIYQYLSPRGTSSWMRVTMIQCVSDCRTDNRDLSSYWSYATGDSPTLDSDALNAYYLEVVPVISSGEYVIMVETILDYQAPFDTIDWSGVGDRTLTDVVITRPRFAPKLDWEGTSGNAGVDDSEGDIPA